jgi:hypothetical protein
MRFSVDEISIRKHPPLPHILFYFILEKILGIILSIEIKKKISDNVR